MEEENKKAAGMLKESTSLRNLPLEIIEGILSRLPVKSLLRFRCVEKSWLSLISSHQFVRLQLRVSAQNSKSEHHRLLLYSKCPTQLFSCSLDPKIDENHVVKRIEFRGNFNRFLVVGSCNGLICVSIGGAELIMWNPVMRKSWNLPDSGSTEDAKKLLSFYYKHAFVYDYKVVEIFYLIDDDDLKFKHALKLYSSKTNSWKKIQNFPSCECRLHMPRILINGALHWMSPDITVSHYRRIISFNICEETFGELSLPDYDNSTNSLWDLCVFKDCLGLIIVDRLRFHWILWVMKEYGVESSWSQLCSIHFKNDLRSLFPPIIFTYSDGDILLRYASYFLLYNSRDKVFKYYKIRESEVYSAVYNAVYVESLASLNFDN